MKISLIFILSFSFILSSFAADGPIITCKNKNMKFKLVQKNNQHTLSYKIKRAKNFEFIAPLLSLNTSSRRFLRGKITRNITDPGRFESSLNTPLQIESLIWVSDKNIGFESDSERYFLSNKTIPVVYYEINESSDEILLEISYYKNHTISEVFKLKNCKF